jgi:hypothetical protein
MSLRQYKWGVTATTVGTVALWSCLAAVFGVPTVWVVVFVLVASVNMGVAGIVAYCARRDATRPEGQRAASPRRGPNVYVEDIAVKMLTGMSFPSRARRPPRTHRLPLPSAIKIGDIGYRSSHSAGSGRSSRRFSSSSGISRPSRGPALS